MAADGDRNDATPQEIWNMLRELTASQRETARLIRELRESGAEADRDMQETRRALRESGAETDRRLQETDRRMRKLDDLFNGQWGKLIEALVTGDLIRLLNRRDIAVHYLSTNVEINRAGRKWEIDILAMNGKELVAVEVKTTLKVRDVGHFLDTLRHVTRILPDYANRAIYGAVAYLKADEAADTYAERQGLFVIRATGSSASITNREDFRPRTFGRSRAHAV